MMDTASLTEANQQHTAIEQGVQTQPAQAVATPLTPEQIIAKGNEYKQSMLNYTDEGNGFVSVEIDGVKIKFEKASLYTPGNQSATPETGGGNTNINYAIGNVDAKAAYFIVDKAKSEGWSEVTLRSLARPSGVAAGSGSNSPHLVTNGARGLDIVSISKNNVTVIFDNANYPNLAAGSPQRVLRDEVFNAMASDNRVRQVFDPWELKSGPNSVINANNWMTEPNNNNAWLHRNHMHITVSGTW
jgi:hypothetical protein